MSDKRAKKELRAIIEQQRIKILERDRRILKLLATPPETIKRVIVEHKEPPHPTEGYGEILDWNGYPAHRFSITIRPSSDTVLDLPYLPDNDTPGPNRYQLRIRWQR